jgi:hypothetical protein
VKGSCSLNLDPSLSISLHIELSACETTTPADKLPITFRLRLAACSKYLASRTQIALREKVFVFSSLRSLPAQTSCSLLTSFYQPELDRLG